MGSEVKELKCPGCGARIAIGMKKCMYCHNPVVVSTFNDVLNTSMPALNKHISSYTEYVNNYGDDNSVNKALGICYLKMGLYEKANAALSAAIDDNMTDSEIYFYLAASKLGGKRPYVNRKADNDEALQYLEIACNIEPRGIYYYFAAYIVHDYYKRKFLKYRTSYDEFMELANEYDFSEYDVNLLQQMLRQDSLA